MLFKYLIFGWQVPQISGLSCWMWWKRKKVKKYTCLVDISFSINYTLSLVRSTYYNRVSQPYTDGIHVSSDNLEWLSFRWCKVFRTRVCLQQQVFPFNMAMWWRQRLSRGGGWEGLLWVLTVLYKVTKISR